MSNKLFTVSYAPHWRTRRTVPEVMHNYIIALLPAAIMAIVYFGIGAFRVMALAGAAAVVTEALSQKLMKRPLTIHDGSALLAGLLFAFLLPYTAPWWLVVLGTVVTIVIGREIFGGFGGSPIPAPLVGWTIMRISWPDLMGIQQSILGKTLAYPLGAVKMMGASAAGDVDMLDLFIGKQLGGLGTVCAAALLLGGVYLLARGYLKPHLPISFIASVFVFALIFNLADPAANPSPLFHVMSGTVIFAAFFLVSEFSAFPVNPLAMIFYGVLAGFLVMIIRTQGIYPDGTHFALLLTSLVTPLLDRVRPRALGKA